MEIDVNELRVDLDQIKKNISILKTNKKFYAVVKANAYGLGACEISKYIEEDVDGFCVASIGEAIELRDCGIKKDILILGYVKEENYQDLHKYNLISTLYNYEIAKKLNEQGVKIRVHLKIETGHNRLGFQLSEKSVKEINEISKFENIVIEGAFTHLTDADEEDKTFSYKQEEIFLKMMDQIGEISKEWIWHIENDAGIIAYDFGDKYQAVRSGISMYGVYPSIYIRDNYHIGIKEAFQLVSKISNIKTIEAGESVSYGRTFIAEKQTKIATISIGYADGYHRVISNKGYVLINGKRANIIGSITMDQLMVDVSDIECSIHDDVVMIGNSKDLFLGVDEVATWAGTISYEMMTSIAPRVKRVYYKEKF